MRRRLQRLLLATLVLAAPGTSTADVYSDFRIPDYKLTTWNLSLSGNLSSSRYAPSGGTDGRSNSGLYRFLAPFRADDVSDRRERFAFVTLQSSPNMSTVQFIGGFLAPGQVNEYRSITRFYAGQASWFESRYPSGGGLSWNWDASVSASMRDSDEAFDYRQVTPTSESVVSFQYRDTDYRQGGSASLGTRLGRVRDVSGVYEAQVLESRLMETGRLLRPLSDAGRQRLAELFYLSEGIASVHDRPSKYLWTEIERVLAEDGALQDGTLDAWSALRALEPVMLLAGSNRRAGRFVGLFGFASAVRGHTDSDQRTEAVETQNGVVTFYSNQQSSEKTTLEEDDAGVGLEWSEHHPLSMRSQVDLRTRITLSSHEKLFAVIQAGTRYMIADRWDAELLAQYDTDAWSSGGERSEPRWFVYTTASLGYLLEDSWSLRASYEAYHIQYRDRDLPAYQARDHFFTLGVTYRAVGRLSTPLAGLASRPMVGGR